MTKILFQGRVVFALLAFLISAFFLFHALKIDFDLSAESIFIEGDSAYEFYKDTYLPQFSHLGVPGIVAIKAHSKQNLVLALKLVQEKLSANPFIKQVISPLDQKIYLSTHEGPRPIEIVEDNELSKGAIEYFSKHPLFKGVFVSHDQKSLALVFMMDVRFQDHDRQERAVKSINSDISTLRTKLKDYDLYVAGLPFIQNRIVSLLKDDQVRLIPFVALFLVILLLLMTKHPLGMLYPLLIIFLAIIWTVGYMSLMGHGINVVNNTIIILILVIGIADSVHIYTRYVEESIREQKSLKPGMAPKKSIIIKNTLKAMLLPCFLTSATTALGFFASSAAGVEIIQEFGYDAAIGVIFCFFVTFLLMPFFLSIHPIPKSHGGYWLKRWPKKLSIDAILQLSIGKSLRYAKFLSGFALILMALSAILSSGMESKQTWVGELPKDDPQVLTLSFVEQNFSGIMPFYVVFSGSEKQLASYETALAIDAIAQKLRAHEIAPVIRSPIDAIDFMLKSNPAPLHLSHIDPETFDELFAMTKTATKAFWSKDKKHLRLEGFLPNVATSKAEAFREYLEQSIKEFAIDGVKITPTGSALISSRALHNITNDMKKSLALAALYITIFVAIFFRSIRYALIAMLPNLLPIGLTLALMNILNMDVRLATVMIFSMALGLSIDTCIHLLCRVQEEILKIPKQFQKLSLIRSIHRAFKGSGRPIIYTTAILLGGFSIMMFSRFLAMHDFAVISVIVILSALFADIILLPAFIWVTRPKTKQGFPHERSSQ